jgi:hydroxypyruvate isomerase
MNLSRRAFLSGAALGLGTLGTTAGLAAGNDPPSPDRKGLPGRTKNTKFAVNVEMWWRKEKDFLKRLEAAAGLGFPAVEFWPWQNKNIPAVAETCERLKLEVAQFTAWGFKPGLNEPKNHNRFVEAVEQGCEVAKKLKCHMMCVVGGDDVPGLTQSQMHENIITGLKKAAPVAEKHGVTLILEAMNIRVDHKGHCLYGSAPTIRIIKAVGSPFVKINWDLYHMHITEGDLCGHLREGFAANAIGYIQLADHPGRNEPGTGEIHYPRVLQELKKLSYKGPVGLECRPLKSEEEAAWAVHRADQW